MSEVFKFAKRKKVETLLTPFHFFIRIFNCEQFLEHFLFITKSSLFIKEKLYLFIKLSSKC